MFYLSHLSLSYAHINFFNSSTFFNFQLFINSFGMKNHEMPEEVEYDIYSTGDTTSVRSVTCPSRPTKQCVIYNNHIEV